MVGINPVLAECKEIAGMIVQGSLVEVVDAVLRTVGGDDRIGEYGSGFGQQDFRLFVSRADVSQQQATGVGFEGHCGCLCGGAVQLLIGDRGKRIVESAFETQQIDVVDIRENSLGIGGVGAVGVTPCGIFATGLFFYQVSVCRDGMDKREGMYAAIVVFENGERPLGMGEFVIMHLEVDMASGHLKDEREGFLYALGGINVDRGCAPT